MTLPRIGYRRTGTRLLARERYVPRNALARLLVEAVPPVSAVMTRWMPRGIRDRAERTLVVRAVRV